MDKVTWSANPPFDAVLVPYDSPSRAYDGTATYDGYSLTFEAPVLTLWTDPSYVPNVPVPLSGNVVVQGLVTRFLLTQGYVPSQASGGSQYGTGTYGYATYGSGGGTYGSGSYGSANYS